MISNFHTHSTALEIFFINSLPLKDFFDERRLSVASL
jgi:hypothetical protein